VLNTITQMSLCLKVVSGCGSHERCPIRVNPDVGYETPVFQVALAFGLLNWGHLIFNIIDLC